MIKYTVYYACIPLEKSFSHAAFIRHTSDSVILEISFNSIVGIGECAPRKYVTGETKNSVKNEVLNIINEKKLNFFLHLNPFDFLLGMMSGSKKFESILSLSNCTRCLIEMAILDYLCKKNLLSLSQVIVGCFGTSAYPSKKITRTLDYSWSINDFLLLDEIDNCIKIKIGKDVNHDTKRIDTVLSSLDEKIPVILDANMGLDCATALILMSKYSQRGNVYFEEPVSKKNFDFLQMAKKIGYKKIMLDESICSLEDIILAVEMHCLDAVNIRLSKMGGISSALKMIRILESVGIEWQLGVQVAEVGPLVAAERHLSCSIGGYFTLEAGVGDEIFSNFIIDNYPCPDRKNNMVKPIDGFGLGVELKDNNGLLEKVFYIESEL